MMEPTQSFFTSGPMAGKGKKHIQIFQTPQGLAITHDDKEQEIARHFEELLRSKHHRAFSLNWKE
jgi:ATP adenylyltransferase/5',5'''-P-1,P-4-tetraphosphate phosphorylase II